MKVSFLCHNPDSHPMHMHHAPVMWVEFPQAFQAWKLSTGSPTSMIKKEFIVHRSKFRQSIDYSTLSISSDWEQRAEHLGRSLDAYTPVPSTSSFMRALVQSNELVTESYTLEWLPIFGRSFGLRCLQPLSSAAWLPGNALSDNR